MQPWYTALEAMRYLLPDDQAREKLMGQSWQVGRAWPDAWQRSSNNTDSGWSNSADSACPLLVLQVKLLKQADRTLELLEGDEAKYADELTSQQKDFAGTLNTLTTVRASAHVWCYGTLSTASSAT